MPAAKGKKGPSSDVKPKAAKKVPLPKLPGAAKRVQVPQLAKTPTTPPEGTPIVEAPPTPLPEVDGKNKPLCWIELVKSGSMFIARSSTKAGVTKEYKNRVLEDMLTELIVELQEEIQE